MSMLSCKKYEPTWKSLTLYDNQHLSDVRTVNQNFPYYLAVFLLLLTACSPLKSVYSEQAYQQAVSLKVESLQLMDRATKPYSENDEAVRQLRTDLQKAYEYARGRPDNEISTRQWEILLDPDRNLVGGFLARWEREDSLSPVFVAENKKIISDAFDTIIELESGKMKPEDLH